MADAGRQGNGVTGSPHTATYVDERLALDQHGETAGTLRRACEALRRARESRDAAATAGALVSVARVRFRLGQYHAAGSLAQEALDLMEPAAPARVDAWQVLGNCAAETGSLTQAETLYRQAADLAREIGYDLGRAAALHGLAAAVYMARGQFDLALAADEEVCHTLRRRGEEQYRVYPLATMAMACQLTGRRDDARARLNELGSLASPGSVVQGYELCIRASLALDEGDVATALDLLGQARSIAEASGEPWLTVEARLGMSHHHRLLGDGPAAFTWANDALAHVTRIGYRHEQGKVHTERARAAWLCGDLSATEGDLRAALRIFDDLGAEFDQARVYLLLAALMHEQQREEVAGALLDAARAITAGGFGFLLEQERAQAFPLMAAHLNSHDRDIGNAAAALANLLRRVPPEPLRIVMLGRFAVWQGNRRVARSSLRQRGAGDLLSVLLLSPGRGLSADQVHEALWPDKSPEAAQGAFHQATSALRRALEPDLPAKFPSRYLEVEEGQITLCLPPGSSIDYEVFEAHIQHSRWEEAVLAYSGDLLPDYRYAEWALACRERLLLKVQWALLAVAEARLDAGRFEEALDACHRLLALEPWQEQAVLLGMRACRARGDVAGARRLYLTLEKTLRRDLDTEPQPELRAFYHSLTS
jgi:DNA-binding SARP family transcriptional activator